MRLTLLVGFLLFAGVSASANAEAETIAAGNGQTVTLPDIREFCLVDLDEDHSDSLVDLVVERFKRSHELVFAMISCPAYSTLKNMSVDHRPYPSLREMGFKTLDLKYVRLDPESTKHLMQLMETGTVDEKRAYFIRQLDFLRSLAAVYHETADEHGYYYSMYRLNEKESGGVGATAIHSAHFSMDGYLYALGLIDLSIPVGEE